MDTQSTFIPFTKMQGAGNDFVVIDNRNLRFSKEELIEWTPQICDRKFGIGSDGLLVLFPSDMEEADFQMFYRNPDGSDAGMCGNGGRCLSLFAHKLGFDRNHTFSVHKNIYQAEVFDQQKVRLTFPAQTSIEELRIEGQTIFKLHTGTEHIVTVVEDEKLDQFEQLTIEGRKLRYHQEFQPKGTNVNFISGVNERELKLQTYERGVEDLTLACGTGALASALVWHHLQDDKQEDIQPLSVITEGGRLNIYFSYDSSNESYSDLQLEGPAQFVFEGKYPLSSLQA